MFPWWLARDSLGWTKIKAKFTRMFFWIPFQIKNTQGTLLIYTQSHSISPSFCKHLLDKVLPWSLSSVWVQVQDCHLLARPKHILLRRFPNFIIFLIFFAFEIIICFLLRFLLRICLPPLYLYYYTTRIWDTSEQGPGPCAVSPVVRTTLVPRTHSTAADNTCIIFFILF